MSLAAGAIVSVIAFTLSMAFRRKFRGEGAFFYLIMLALMTPGFLLALGTQLFWSWLGRGAVAVADRARRERDLGDPVRLPRDARGLESLRRADRGGRARPRRRPEADLPGGDAPARVDGHLRLLPLRLHADLERLRPLDPARQRLRDPDAAADDRRASRSPARSGPTSTRSAPRRRSSRWARSCSCSSSPRSACASAGGVPLPRSKRSSASRRGWTWARRAPPRTRSRPRCRRRSSSSRPAARSRCAPSPGRASSCPRRRPRSCSRCSPGPMPRR